MTTVQWDEDRIVVRGLEDAREVDLVGLDGDLRAVEICAQPGEDATLDPERAFCWSVYGSPATDNHGRRPPITVSLPSPAASLTIFVIDSEGAVLNARVLGTPHVRPVRAAS